MKMLLVIPLMILIIGLYTYPKWSYKQYERRCKLNSLHPNWKPKCGTNYLESDREWFIRNGYGDGHYVSDREYKKIINKENT